MTLSFPLIGIKEIKLFRCVLVINGLDYAKCGVKWMNFFFGKTLSQCSVIDPTKQQNVKLIQIENICKQRNASHKSRVVLVRVKNLEETEKIMVMSIFALSCSVFRRLFLRGRESRDSLVKSSGPSNRNMTVQSKYDLGRV